MFVPRRHLVAVVIFTAKKEEVRQSSAESVLTGRRFGMDGRVRKAQDFNPIDI